jgi:uncharacterized protein YqgQ
MSLVLYGIFVLMRIRAYMKEMFQIIVSVLEKISLFSPRGQTYFLDSFVSFGVR